MREPGKAAGEMGWTPVPKEHGWKEIREEENTRCLGGQRNPRTALGRVPGLRVVGHLVRAVYRAFRARHPKEVDQVPIGFGTPGAAPPSEELVKAFRRELRSALGAAPEFRPTRRYGAESPLQANLIDKWLAKAGDPERALKGWIEDGVPLGIEAPIECFGVFPPNTNPKKNPVSYGKGALDTAINNYLSMKDQPEDAEIETERLIALGYLSRVPRHELNTIVGVKGKPARLALIVKEKV